jgi:trk system potassium uptake protein TrkH
VLRLPPPAVLALLFLTLIAAGTLALKAPIAVKVPISWLDAAFTATSAVTVTGLAVVDTATEYTTFGQVVILILIQLGGLGLMTFAVMVLALLGQRIGLRQQILLREDLNQTSLGDVVRLVRTVAAVVLVLEAAGVVLLGLRWVPDYGLSHGLYLALFHSISAFNNAGFALWPDSLTRWSADPVVNAVIPLLFIVGGLGFSVINELRQRRRWTHLSLHTRLMLVGTAGLIAWSFLAFLALEWTNPATLGGCDNLWQRLATAWFQAVTTRTAGFNTLDVSQLRDGTALMFISMMFIGGGSTSTAGGIKVTSFMVLLMASAAFLRRRPEPTAFSRRVVPADVLKVLALTFIGLLVVMIGTFLLTVSQHARFLDLAFEAASAFGTVGLSRGVTPELNAFGRLVVMTLMFLGRVGPLALGFALATSSATRVRYPAGRVYLG